MHLALSTVKVHVHNILQKTGQPTARRSPRLLEDVVEWPRACQKPGGNGASENVPLPPGFWHAPLSRSLYCFASHLLDMLTMPLTRKSNW